MMTGRIAPILVAAVSAFALAAGPAAAAAPRKAVGPWRAAETVAQKMIDDRLVPGLQVCVRKRGAVVFSNCRRSTAMDRLMKSSRS